MLSINFDKLGIFTTGKHPPLYLVRSDMREAKTHAGHDAPAVKVVKPLVRPLPELVKRPTIGLN